MKTTPLNRLDFYSIFFLLSRCSAPLRCGIPILIGVILFPIFGNAQTVWAPLGAEWYYEHWETNNSPYGVGYHHYTVEGDSTFLGQPCRYVSLVTKRVTGAEEYDGFFTYESNDSVFLAQDDFPEFVLIMDFGLEIGDTVNLKSWKHAIFTDSADFMLTDFTTEDLDGTELKKWELDYLPSFGAPCPLIKTYYERVGHFYGILRNQQNCAVVENYRVKLTCYSDDSINIHLSDNPCDYFAVVSGTNDLEASLTEIFPNPANDFLEVRRTAAETSIGYQIIDYLGRPIMTGEIVALAHRINIDELRPGMYALQFLDKKGNSFVQQFLKL